MKVFIIIAAYNEEKSISKVIKDLKKEGYSNIIVVNDGSSDSTQNKAEDAGAVVLTHVINRGQGAALKTGIDYAIFQGADIVVTFDADGQFLASEIKKVIEPIISDEADIVLGSRFLGSAKNIPLLKKIILKIGVIFVYLLYGIKVSDSQNGFRAMSRKAAEMININSNRMEHAGEILHEIRQKNLKYKEVPVTVIYSDYAIKKGQNWTHSFGLGLNMILKKLTR
ncbi:MAG: glycosyltransferase family 2 protein [archaeon]